MQTLEQALADLVIRGIVSKETALSRSSRPDQLLGVLKRGGFEALEDLTGGLRAAGG
jgi:hypothetical protein